MLNEDGSEALAEAVPRSKDHQAVTPHIGFACHYRFEDSDDEAHLGSLLSMLTQVHACCLS
jgi:hypothetical protein